MLARQFIHLKRNFSSLRPRVIVNKHKFLCTLNADSRVRFCSDHCKDDLPALKSDDSNNQEKIIKLELALFRDQGKRVPDLNSIEPHHWNELVKLKTPSARNKYYSFLHIMEKNREKKIMMKQQKALNESAFREQKAREGNTSFFKKSTFFLRIYPDAVKQWRNNRLKRAMQFGDKLIFDCSYDSFMTTKEATAAGKQLALTFAENRQHKDPFDLHFCNVNFNGRTFANLERIIPTVQSETFPLNLHAGSYLDVFPKEKLVYLTPHCRNDLTDFDPDSIYIIGAMVDTSNHQPLSMMKAKELGLKMARLPLDRYLDWGTGDKTLTLNQMMKIILAWKTDRSWDSALKHVPSRKLKNKDFGKPKASRQWTVIANKSFDYDAGSARTEALSTDDKFKRKIGTDNQWSYKNYERSTLSVAEKFKRRPNDDFSQNDGTTDKFKERISSKSSVNVKKIPVK